MRFAAAGHVIRALGAVSLALVSLLAAGPAMAADQPKVPQQVAAYFADGLIPRLIDLYGAGNGVTTGIDFDATTTVGGVSRVLEWTPDFLAGKSTDNPTQLTNNWVAPVSLRGEVIGLATVWINPADDLPELATFNPPELARLLASAPAKSLLVQDEQHSAWFAIDGDVLTPLVAGNSGVTSVTTPDAYQRTISDITESEQSGGAPSGVVVAGIVLGAVIVALIVFVLLPDRRRKKDTADAAPEPAAAARPEPDPEPGPEPAPGPESAKKAPSQTPASQKAGSAKGAPQKTSTAKAPAAKTPARQPTGKTPTAKKPGAGPGLREGVDDR